MDFDWNSPGINSTPIGFCFANCNANSAASACLALLCSLACAANLCLCNNKALSRCFDAVAGFDGVSFQTDKPQSPLSVPEIL